MLWIQSFIYPFLYFLEHMCVTWAVKTVHIAPQKRGNVNYIAWGNVNYIA